MTLGVLLVDDEPLIRSGLRAIIDAERDLAVVGEADDGAAVSPLVRRLRPHVVLMDVRMPVVDGIEATRRLLVNVDDPPRVIVLTTFENDDYVLDALHAGAAGFLLKRARPDEVVRAVRLVAAGDSLLFPAAIRQLVTRARPTQARDRRLHDAGLTEREAEVLRLIAEGLSNAEIAARLTVSLETVKTHVARVLTQDRRPGPHPSGDPRLPERLRRPDLDLLGHGSRRSFVTPARRSGTSCPPTVPFRPPEALLSGVFRAQKGLFRWL